MAVTASVKSNTVTYLFLAPILLAFVLLSSIVAFEVFPPISGSAGLGPIPAPLSAVWRDSETGPSPALHISKEKLISLAGSLQRYGILKQITIRVFLLLIINFAIISYLAVIIHNTKIRYLYVCFTYILTTFIFLAFVEIGGLAYYYKRQHNMEFEFGFLVYYCGGNNFCGENMTK